MDPNLPLTPELERLLRAQLEAGQFPTAGAAVEAALRLLEEHGAGTLSVPDPAFGLWKGRVQDGLAYQEALRAEWDR